MALPTDLDTLLARVDALREEIDALRPLTDEQKGRAMQRLRIEWTYHSNAIEGNSLTYGETRALLMHGVTAHGKPLKDHLDIRRHREVIKYLEAFVRSDEPLTLHVLREMHRMLMGDEYEVVTGRPDGSRSRRTERGGTFKTHPNSVVTETGETHYYKTPEETPALMVDLVDSLGQPEEVHPVVRAARFHHRFVEIHPFADGNGRTARVLMNLLLMRAGYVPAVLRQQERPAYYGALAAADGGESHPIIAFVGEELAGTMELYLRALKGEPDPTAFDRRVDLLLREAEGAKPAETFGEAEGIRLSNVLFAPLLAEGERRASQLAPLFGEVNQVLVVTGTEGNQVFRDEARALLEQGAVTSFSFEWRFSDLRVDPAVSVWCTCHGRSGDGIFVIQCKPGNSAYRFQPGQSFSEKDAVKIADALFGPVISVIEKAIKK